MSIDPLCLDAVAPWLRIPQNVVLVSVALRLRVAGQKAVANISTRERLQMSRRGPKFLIVEIHCADCRTFDAYFDQMEGCFQTPVQIGRWVYARPHT